METVATDVFPFETFRGKQHQVLEASLKALYDDGYKNLVIDAPVGAGKSALNVALLRRAEDGFYTTPSKSLRQQLQNDEVLREYFSILKARRDYTCSITGDNCEDCSINQSTDKSCSEQGQKCTYWGQKMGSINDNISVLTFSYLIVDGMLPKEANGTPISFGNRDMIVVDEAQNLVTQTRSLHAGFKISPYSLPRSVFKGATSSADYDANSYEDVEDIVGTIYARCRDYPRDGVPPFEMEPAEKTCMRLADKIEWMIEEIDERGNPWVVDVDSTKYKGNYVKTLELRPINVSTFLRNNVWNRANKRVISTATLPYRDNPRIWLRKVGLDPNNTKVISVPMRFPEENRPIHTSSQVCSMSSNGDEENWGDIMEKLNELAEDNYNKKGLVHTASYNRAQMIEDSITEDNYPYLHQNVIVHNPDRDTEVQIEEWQNSDHDIMLSPSMMEGVDLKDDMCRWQVLLKVPYPAMDSVVKHITQNEKYGWNEYFERALIRVVQSYGRGIRSKDDFCDYYVLDEDFSDLIQRRSPPNWFQNVIDIQPPKSERSIFDY